MARLPPCYFYFYDSSHLDLGPLPNQLATQRRRAAVGRMLASDSECMTHRDDSPAPVPPWPVARTIPAQPRPPYC
nr:hypothetical protein [uncultured Halomonas sp.]